MIEKKPELKKALGPLNLITMGVGAIIGAGIFVLTGTASAQYAGPGIVLSFILSAIVCVLAGLCYAEFSALIPKAGSAYSFALATMGKTIAWIIGWDLILEYLFAAATVAVGWSGYMVSFFSDLGIHIPKALSQSPFGFKPELGWHTTGAILNLPAMAIIGIAALFLYRGITESAKLTAVIVVIKLSVILSFIAFGMPHIQLSNLTPFIPNNTGVWGEFGISGVCRAASVIFFAYIGFDAVSTSAQECKNPQKDLPIGILGSLFISTLLYIAVAIVLTGVVHYSFLNVPDPIAVGVNAMGPQLYWLRPLVKLGAIAGLSSVILVMMMGQTRIFYALSCDGFLPKLFSNVHLKYQSPHTATLITAIAAMLIAGILPLGLLGELVSIGTLLAFAIVCAGIWILRIKKPHLPRPFKTPFVPLVPILGVITSVAQMLYLPKDTWLRLFIWMALGCIVYAFYGRKVKINSE